MAYSLPSWSTGDPPTLAKFEDYNDSIAMNRSDAGWECPVNARPISNAPSTSWKVFIDGVASGTTLGTVGGTEQDIDISSLSTGLHRIGFGVSYPYTSTKMFFLKRDAQNYMSWSAKDYGSSLYYVTAVLHNAAESMTISWT